MWTWANDIFHAVKPLCHLNSPDQPGLVKTWKLSSISYGQYLNGRLPTKVDVGHCKEETTANHLLLISSHVYCLRGRTFFSIPVGNLRNWDLLNQHPQSQLSRVHWRETITVSKCLNNTDKNIPQFLPLTLKVFKTELPIKKLARREEPKENPIYRSLSHYVNTWFSIHRQQPGSASRYNSPSIPSHQQYQVADFFLHKYI